MFIFCVFIVNNKLKCLLVCVDEFVVIAMLSYFGFWTMKSLNKKKIYYLILSLDLNCIV